MAVLISLGGNSAGDGFLVAPVGGNYDAELSLATDAGTLTVTLQASPDAGGLVFSQTNVNLTTVPTIVNVHATLQSASREDTTIQVLDPASNVVASFTVTSIKHPAVNFSGRFEARFATQPAFYNQNPFYTPVSSAVGPGWTWGLEGEQEFVPAVGNVPENLETPGMGRVIRLNNPIALRSHAAPVVSVVDSITGDTVLGPETFATGDPLIGQPVNFGPDTYFAGNRNINSADEEPEEFWSDAFEPLGLFEIHLGALFSGASQVGPFVSKAVVIDTPTRTPDSRPIATGLEAAPEHAAIGLPSLTAFGAARIDLLVADYNALPVGDTPERRNLVRRIGHLLNSVTVAKRNAVQAANPGAFTPLPGSPSTVWGVKEVFKGKVDTNLVFQPAASPVIAYMAEFTSFNVEWNPFSFHTDELCAHHKGTLTHMNADGTYSGDPHTRTVNGVLYDFQAVGEFTLLRDASRMEIQTRQSPVATQNPITDSYTGLTSCVSVNTAVAARLGKHRISLQPGREGQRLEFYLNGKLTNLSPEGIDLDGHRVTTFDANGEPGLRVDFEDQTVLVVTPLFWNAHKIWYMNVSVTNTRADEGIMGVTPRDSWLPRLRNGKSVGPMPASLNDRYITLYKTFADSWRVTPKTSLFVYARGTSTKTFTDRDWPAGKPPCKLKPAFKVPGVPVFTGMPVDRARVICKAVMMKDLHNNCVFDVATTGDKVFAEGYLFAQELRLHGTFVTLTGGEAPLRQDRLPVETEVAPQGRDLVVALTATVSPITPGRPTPTGTVTFFIDGMPMKRPTQLNGRGQARVVVPELKPGEHKIRAAYSGGGRYEYHSSSSSNLILYLPADRPKRGGKEPV